VRPGTVAPPDVKILAVDDNATNRAILAAYLGAETAASGAEALAMMHAAARDGKPFDLVVLDHRMPEMDALDVAAAVRRAPRLRDTRLVMLTSAGDDRERARELGVSAYLTKPIRRARLLEAVAGAAGADAMPPAPRPAEPAARARAAPAAEATAGQVLVAEDNAVNQLVIETMLVKRGFGVELAADGAEALEKLASGSFAAVFMDCQMPGVDGYEATERIRSGELAGSPRVPVIAMTAHAMKGDRERCLMAGMDDYLAKPVQAAELYELIERIVPVEAHADTAYTAAG
jgi:CheY-like chemotaxis protein